jgi:hypothetical protein
VPQDLEQRLNEILTRCAVVPSAAMGLLGELGRLVVSGDGTALRSHAAGHGHHDCTCRQDGILECTCPRRYSDPEATWGWDSHRESYYFGYRLHVMATRGDGEHDLPLRISIAGAHTPDVVLGVEAVLRLSRRLSAQDLGAKMWAAVYDAGYDATLYYRLHQALSIRPVIPLAQEKKTPACAQGVRRNEAGTPLCAGDVPMRLHQRDLPGQQLVYTCPVKRPCREEGKYTYRAREEECPRGVLCEPESVLGPIVRIRLDGDPRMNLLIPRESALFAELYRQRTATERFNSTLKSKGRMATGAYRRQHLMLAAAVLHGVGLHAVAQTERLLGKGRPMTVEAALAWLEGQVHGEQRAA